VLVALLFLRALVAIAVLLPPAPTLTGDVDPVERPPLRR
jgi:hypothetical protein